MKALGARRRKFTGMNLNILPLHNSLDYNLTSPFCPESKKVSLYSHTLLHPGMK
jgi:hypothetical protein